MHPAKSVIFFTTASGAGYGLMIWLALFAALGLLPADAALGIVAFGLGFALIIGGLLSSTLHLGRPERAWRALSQWRSSWLSREGVMAIVTFAPLGLFSLSWVVLEENHGPAALIGFAGAAMSLLTIYTTSMIYASLKAIPAWHNGWTVAGYLLIGPTSGLVLLGLLLALFGRREALELAQLLALVMVPVMLAVKVLYFRHMGQSAPSSTIGSATGLGHLGKVEMTASPHDADNYLLREMGFRIARRHAHKLRRIMMLLWMGAVFLLVSLWWLDSAIAQFAVWLLAGFACLAGVVIERWLFFAEAKHAVTLYYGEQAV